MAPLAVAELDRDLFTWVVEHRAPPFDWLFVALSVAGHAGLLWIAMAPVLARWAGKPVLFTTLVTAATVWAADLLAAADDLGRRVTEAWVYHGWVIYFDEKAVVSTIKRVGRFEPQYD